MPPGQQRAPLLCLTRSDAPACRYKTGLVPTASQPKLFSSLAFIQNSHPGRSLDQAHEGLDPCFPKGGATDSKSRRVVMKMMQTIYCEFVNIVKHWWVPMSCTAKYCVWHVDNGDSGLDGIATHGGVGHISSTGFLRSRRGGLACGPVKYTACKLSSRRHVAVARKMRDSRLGKAGVGAKNSVEFQDG